MSNDTGNAGDVTVKRRYEPPRVVPAGNLRDLVAEGGSGILRLEGIQKLEESSHSRR
jgi:hypothetical protein